MVDEYTHSIIEQLTLRKLDYVRSLLKAVDFPYSGTRLVVRQRLVEAIESNIITVYDLHTLLDELDAWGDQRLRIGHLPTNILAEFQSASDVASHAAAAGLSHLLQGEIMLVPPPQLTPMKISYAEQTGQKRLHMVAAKTRQVMLPQPDIPDFVDQQYPGIVFKPFKGRCCTNR